MLRTPELFIVGVLAVVGVGAWWFLGTEDRVSQDVAHAPIATVDTNHETRSTEIIKDEAMIGDRSILGSNQDEEEIKEIPEVVVDTEASAPLSPDPVSPPVAPVLTTPEPVLQTSFEWYREIVEPSGFVNSDPFQLADLVGEKVMLLKFTTYSCTNCQRTYPFVKWWDLKYRDEGLATVFIHTPEFSFEHDIDNVRAAMEKEGITFPVVLDNEYATWRSYGNRFWPRMYLIDIHGNIVYDHIGEGAYEETEAKIIELLAERKEFLEEN